MRRTVSMLAVAFFSLGFLLSGAQTITGYYADPSAYGFHHIQSGYLQVSVAMSLLGGILLLILLKRLDGLCW